MSDGSAPPDPGTSHWPKIEEAYRGFFAFGVLNLLAFLAANELVQTTIAAVVFGAAIAALAAWSYRRLDRHALAAGLLGGYALMSIISGGTCTLFVGQPQPTTSNVLRGAFLYVAAIIIFGLVLLNHRLSDSE